MQPGKERDVRLFRLPSSFVLWFNWVGVAVWTVRAAITQLPSALYDNAEAGSRRLLKDHYILHFISLCTVSLVRVKIYIFQGGIQTIIQAGSGSQVLRLLPFPSTTSSIISRRGPLKELLPLMSQSMPAMTTSPNITGPA